MSSWAETYIGWIFQVYGLAFFALGITALIARQQGGIARLAEHLGWLAAFGMLHGLQELTDGLRLQAPAPWLTVLSTVLMVSGFTALLEFGRRVWNMRSDGARLAALPVFTAAGLGTLVLMLAAPTVHAGLEVGARYLLGAPGALLAGVGLYVHSRIVPLAPDTRFICLWLRVTGLAMLGYAALTLFVFPDSGGLLTAWLPTRADFLATTGLPVEIARALCALLLAAGLGSLAQRDAAMTSATLRRVTNQINGFVYRCRNDHDWTVTFISDGCAAMTGFPADAFLSGGIHFADMIHPDDKQRVWDEVQNGLAARRDFRIEYRLVDRAGGMRWCYEEGRGFFGDKGELQFLEGHVQDDSARIQLRQALQRERDFAKRLLDTAPIIVLLLDPRGLIQYVNPYFEQLGGYRLDEIKCREWSATFVHARDQARNRELFHRTAHNQPPRREVSNIVARDGEERAIEWESVPLHDLDGQITGVLSIGADVTDRMRLEGRLREINLSLEQRVVERTEELEGELQRNAAILGTAVDGFFAADATGRIRQTNAAFCAMLGYDEAELKSLSIPDFEAARTPEETAANLDKVLVQGHDRFDSKHRRKDGSTLDVEVSVSKVTIGGEPTFYAFVRDITPRKSAEALLRQARDEAEHASAAKSEFLSRMSHELRTPLNAILGFTQLLQLPTDESLSAQHADHVREIHHASAHLLELVNEVLDLARVESGHLEVNVESVELSPLIERCATLIAPKAAQRSIEVRLEPGERSVVRADPTRLKQVLLNLLSNAVKYNRECGRIEVLCARVSGQRVRVSVSDTGRGLTEELQARLFRFFERLEPAYDGIEGTGVGLALAKLLVEGMDGEIGVNSSPGKGSTFWFELPLSTEAASREGLVAEPDQAPLDEQARHKVLYVEDNPANLRLVERILARRVDIELLTSTTGEDGWALAGRERPALILLDINMPDMNGYEVLDLLKQDAELKDIPVLAVTANAMPRDVVHGKQAGFADYITKPIHVGTFLDSVNRWLGHKSNANG